MKMIVRAFICLGLSVFIAAASQGPIRDNYQIWCQGKCDIDAQPTSTKSGVVLMGGGTDTDEAFVWQIGNANGGDFVVLRTSGDDAYNPYIWDLSVASKHPLNSVTTILMKNSKASSESEVIATLQKAEAIFLAGGDQSEYLDYWMNTQIQSIIQQKLANITVGGTSAGCMVLSNWIYSAEEGSTVSDEALANPYDKLITFSSAFLKIPYLETTLLDTHFVTRNRMGRLQTFVARIMKDVDAKPPSLARGIGIDEHTALLLEPSGSVSTVGVGTAYICTADHKAQVCTEDTPLTFQDVQCVRLSAKNNDKYSFSTWKGDGTAYTSDIVKGQFLNSPYGPTN